MVALSGGVVMVWLWQCGGMAVWFWYGGGVVLVMVWWWWCARDGVVVV
jgi:hypothetical protein